MTWTKEEFENHERLKNAVVGAAERQVKVYEAQVNKTRAERGEAACQLIDAVQALKNFRKQIDGR